MALNNFRSLLLISFTGKLINALAGAITLPLLAKILGPESVGLVGFFTTLLMTMMVLEGGLTSNVIQTIAGLKKHHATASHTNTLRVLSIANTNCAAMVGIGLLITATTVLSANYVATNWLSFDNFNYAQVARSIIYMGIFIGLNFPIMILQGVLVGQESQLRLNLLYIPYGLMRSLGACLLLYALGNTASVETFFFIQVIVQLVYAFSLLVSIYQPTSFKPWQVPLRLSYIKDGFQFSKGVFFISLTSIVIIQYDKIYLSGHLPLNDYAAYALASTLAGVTYIFSAALHSVLFPRFSASLKAGDHSTLVKTFSSALSGIAILMMIICTATWMTADFFLHLLFQPDLASKTAKVLPILLTGCAIQSLMIVLYALQLAAQWTRLSLRINLAAIPFILVLVPVMTSQYGYVGAAFVWLGYNLSSLILNTYFVLKRFHYLTPSVVKVCKISGLTLIMLLAVFYLVNAWLLPYFPSAQA